MSQMEARGVGCGFVRRIEQRMHCEELVEAGQGLKVEFSLSSLLLSLLPRTRNTKIIALEDEDVQYASRPQCHASSNPPHFQSASTKTHTAYSPKYPRSIAQQHLYVHHRLFHHYHYQTP